MNRDAILATIIGFGIGLLIMGVLLVGPNLIKTLPQISWPQISLPKLPSREAPSPTTPPSTTTQLTIDSPLSDTVISEAEILVSGTAPARSLVVIAGYQDEVTVKTNDQGGFAGKIILQEGKNEIIVTNYENNKATAKSVTVFYTPEEF